MGDFEKVLFKCQNEAYSAKFSWCNFSPKSFSKEQYEENIATKKAQNVVEFAIKLLADGAAQYICLLIPNFGDTYFARDAVESRDKQRIESAQKHWFSVYGEAKGYSLYIDPPNTNESEYASSVWRALQRGCQYGTGSFLA